MSGVKKTRDGEQERSMGENRKRKWIKKTEKDNETQSTEEKWREEVYKRV